MNKAVSILLRLFGINRPKPRARLGRYARRLERFLLVVTLLYVGLHLYPQVLFAHSVTSEGITFYSRSPLPPQATMTVAEAGALVRQCELAVANRRERVFVCDSPWIFRLFHLTGTRAFAYSVPFTDHVFVAEADFHRGVAVRPASDFNTRALSGVIAHEITHGLIRHRLGVVRGMRLPQWLAEGYCDYVARESTFPEADGRRRVASGSDHPSMAYRYFLYRQMVAYLIEHERLSFMQVVSRASDHSAVERQTRLSLQVREPQ